MIANSNRLALLLSDESKDGKLNDTERAKALRILTSSNIFDKAIIYAYTIVYYVIGLSVAFLRLSPD